MLITMDRTGGYEDLLRSLGAVLDERGARTVIVRDIPAGLLVRAVMPPGGAGDPCGGLAPIDRVFASPTLLEAQVTALLRRGTEHVAGPIEQALRVVGREIDTQGLRDATAVQGPSDTRHVRRPSCKSKAAVVLVERCIRVSHRVEPLTSNTYGHVQEQRQVARAMATVLGG